MSRNSRRKWTNLAFRRPPSRTWRSIIALLMYDVTSLPRSPPYLSKQKEKKQIVARAPLMVQWINNCACSYASWTPQATAGQTRPTARVLCSRTPEGNARSMWGMPTQTTQGPSGQQPLSHAWASRRGGMGRQADYPTLVRWGRLQRSRSHWGE